MSRSLVRALLLVCVALLLGAVGAVAQSTDEPLLGGENGAVLVGIQKDVSLPAGEEADAVIVVSSAADVAGTAKGLVAIDADVTIASGATVDSIFAIGGTLEVADGATVKDIAYADTEPTIAPNATVTGKVSDMEADFTDFAGFLVAALAVIAFFIFIGWLLAVLIAALLLVAFGTSQARRAAANIGGDVLKTLVAGLLMLIVPWIVIGLLAVTVVGLPLAIGLGFMWGFVAFLGWLVVGLWIGERILSRSRTAARPYGAAFLGVLILMLLSWIPFVSVDRDVVRPGGRDAGRLARPAQRRRAAGDGRWMGPALPDAAVRPGLWPGAVPAAPVRAPAPAARLLAAAAGRAASGLAAGLTAGPWTRDGAPGGLSPPGVPGSRRR